MLNTKQKSKRAQRKLGKRIIIELDDDDAEEVIFQIQRLSELLEALDFDRIHDFLSRLSALDEVPKKAKRKSRGSA